MTSTMTIAHSHSRNREGLTRRLEGTALAAGCGLLAALLSVGLADTAGAQEKAAPAGTPKIEFEKYVLPNGAQVILHIDRKLPIVHVNEWFHVGSKNERPGRTGFAHLFEHLMFQGSKDAPGEYFQYAEKAGASLDAGGVNGTTGEDRTNYFITVPAGSLEFALWLESDRLATLADTFNQKDLDSQRDVVKNERRQGLENQPYGRAFKLIAENLYPLGHPYAHDVIGSQEDLTAASLDDVKSFFRTYYTPNNLTLVIAGDFDPAEAKRLVEKYFGTIPAGPALDRPARMAAHLDGEEVIEVNDRVPQERTYIAWPSPALYAAGDADLDLLATIMTDGLSARLTKTLVYDKQLCTGVNAFQMSLEDAGGFIVIATARPGVSLAQIEPIIGEEIAKLAKSGPTQAELNRAKAKWEYQFVSALERIGGFGGKADRLAQYNTYLGKPDNFAADMDRYRNATTKSVQEAAKRWLDTSNRLVLRFHPETSGREAQVAVDRTKAPTLAADRPFAAPEVQGTTLANGLQLFVLERHDLPKVAVSLVDRAGSMNDPAGKEGLAALVARTIDLGTRTKKALQIEDALGDLGTTLQASADVEQTLVGMEVLSRNLDPAVAILADVILNPTFPASEVERERKRTIDRIGQMEKQGEAVAYRLSQMLLFGPEHPYGHPTAGFKGTVASLTPQDLVDFHKQLFKPGAAALVFAGDITLTQAKSLAEKHFGKWAGAAPPPMVMPAPKPYDPTRIYLVDRQDSASTVVTQALPGPPRSTADYYDLVLADAVFGGAFTSRLNLNIREDKGYSYGVFSNPSFYSKAGAWQTFGSVHGEKTKEAVAEFVKELRGLGVDKPITDAELAMAKANRIRSYSQEFESLSLVGYRIAELWTLGLPMSEMQREPGELEKAQLAAVNATAKKYAVPGKAVLLLVGDRKKIEAPLKELKAGDIVLLDVEGKPVVKTP